jgi:lactoylglutathione lyase
MALSVKNLDRSAEFYKKVLQLQEIHNPTKIEGIRWFSLGDNKELHLLEVPGESITKHKAVHLALTTAHFDSFLKALVALQVPYSDWPGTPQKVNLRADGIKQVYFQDPDENWIEVNSVAIQGKGSKK